MGQGRYSVPWDDWHTRYCVEISAACFFRLTLPFPLTWLGRGKEINGPSPLILRWNLRESAQNHWVIPRKGTGETRTLHKRSSISHRENSQNPGSKGLSPLRGRGQSPLQSLGHPLYPHGVVQWRSLLTFGPAGSKWWGWPCGIIVWLMILW